MKTSFADNCTLWLWAPAFACVRMGDERRVMNVS
jgi:hypothetical protein